MTLQLPSIFSYKRSYLKHDIVAAIVVTAISIPQSLAFAIIVGLPPVTGLYTAMIAPVVFALLSHTRRTIVGPDSATTAVVASGALLVAAAGTAAHVNAVATICLMAAAILIVMAVFQLGFLAELISRPVLVGFFAGVGLQLIVSSLTTMVGLAASGSAWNHIHVLAQSLSSVNGMTITVSVLVVGLVVILRKTVIPGELAALVLAVVFAIVFNVSKYGVTMLGELPSGMPHFVFPSIAPDQIVTLFPAALSVALVILAQGASVVKSTAAAHNEHVRINKDLFAFGFANVASSLFQGFSANGSIARTQASEGAHGKSQLVNIFASVLVAILLLFGADLFRYMPQAALASIVCVIGFYLIKFSELDYLWVTHRTEFFVAIVAAIGTVMFGVLQGVFIAVIVSLVERLSRQYRPKDAILLRDGEFSDWALERLGKNHAHDDVEGILVYSFDGALFFENSAYFVNRVRRAIKNAEHPVRVVVVDAGAIDSVDYTAVEELKQFCARLSAKGISLSFSHVSPELQRQFDKYGVTDIVDGHIYATLNDALHAARGRHKASAKS